jgi:hypothetical protein
MNVMVFGGLLERCTSQSKDPPSNKARNGSTNGGERSRRRKRQKESENAKGNETGKAATEKRGELRRLG